MKKSRMISYVFFGILACCVMIVVSGQFNNKFAAFAADNYSSVRGDKNPTDTNPFFIGTDNKQYFYCGFDNSNNLVPDVDFASIKIFGHGFYADKNRVYAMQTYFAHCDLGVVDGVDRDSFEVLNEYYFKDKNSVYNYYTYYRGAGGVKKFESAELSTFKALKGKYAKDQNNVYYYYGFNQVDDNNVIKVNGADAASFEVLREDNEFAMDKKNMYYKGRILDDTNSNFKANFSSSLVIKISDDRLYNSLKGKIIIKTQGKGEAYYISPTKKEMYYLPRPVIAFNIMRKQGIGIIDANLKKISVGGYCPDYQADCHSPVMHSFNFAKQQKGKIFIQVDGSGEAWYVNPGDSKRYYLGRPADAFNVMRALGFGISNADFDKLAD